MTERFKSILLVAPAFHKGKHQLSIAPMAGLGYVAEALGNNGFRIDVLDMNLGYDENTLYSRIDSFKPDLVGFTCMTFGYRELYSLFDRLKRSYPGISLAAGGPHISTLREAVLEECRSIDFGIILEGDRSIVELSAGADPASIQGLIYRKDGKVIANPYTEFIKDLDSVPFPRYGAFELDKYPVRQIGIVTSRGCPYDCIYCPVITAIGKRFRSRSAENVVTEIDYWYSKGYREILVLDDNFTLLKKRTEEICDLLIKRDFRGLVLKCPNGIRADKVDRELLKKMRKAGFNMVAFGVEAGTDKVLARIHKGEGIAVIENSIKDATELGFEVDLFFLIGSPGETMEDFKQSLDLALRYPIRNANFYNVIPFPTTELYHWVNDNKYLLSSTEDILNDASHFVNNPCFFTPEMSRDERKQAFLLGKSVSRKLRRNFIERKLNAPAVFKRLFSWLYTEPFTERMIFNNSVFIKSKELLKRIFVKIT